MRHAVAYLSLVVIISLAPCPSAALARTAQASHRSYTPAVITLQIVQASRVAKLLHGVYPEASIQVDSGTNSVIVIAPPDVVNGARSLAAGIDVRDPTESVVDTVQIHNASTTDIVTRIKPLFPHARILTAPNRTILILASPTDMTQIKAAIATVDIPLPTPTPQPLYPTEAVQVVQASAKQIARAVAKTNSHIRVAVSHGSILLTGPPDMVAQAQTLIGQLDVPQPGVQYTEVYRLHYVDAQSTAELVRRAYPKSTVTVDAALNAITVLGSSAVQRRLADAIAQLDASPIAAASSSQGSGSAGALQTVVTTLKAAIPGLNGAPSTTSTDIATTVTQALAAAAPDLKITVVPNSSQLVLTGSPYSIKLARDLIDQLDVPMPLVVLDTEVYEVDANASKNLGLEISSPVISSNFTELQPPLDASGDVPKLMRVHGFTRTPIAFAAQLNLLLQRGQGKVLADPRITTVSGRTASIRAGDTISILTTTGGGNGTVPTTQVQQFQTGVTLDITPIVNADNYITVTLHPSVNSLEGFNNGVPQIATRDTTTTVGLRSDQTLIIGGLIEDSQTSTSTRIPLLGDLPIVGSLFRSDSIQYQRNEVIVTVTPHIIEPGLAASGAGRGSVAPRRPEPLPTLPPNTKLPPPSGIESLPTPAPYFSPLPVASASMSPSPAPAAMPLKSTQSQAATPMPLPSAFGLTNVFTYGAAPQNNYGAPGSAPQIYYVQVSPTVVRAGTPVTVSANTSTNVTELSFGYRSDGASTRIVNIAPGQWQATFPFSLAGLPGTAGNIQMTLTAKTSLGSVVTVPIPMSTIQ